MTDRSLGEDLLAVPLEHEPLPADEVDEGSPTTATRELGVLAGAHGVEVGVWEMTEGTARDTEADEIFIVLSGSGQVRFADGSVVELSPGVAVRLHAGEQTTWSITSPLRKVYVAGL
ncbi:MAG: cupin domain-containing protein [Nocardioides sp.]|uniref:cupin domain-containing protein n=1 Tax=Nocardioides sp. TaxID=35761 RepID=UPI0039E605FC